MDTVAVRLAKLKREAQKEWKRKWRPKLRQATPGQSAEWRAVGADGSVHPLLRLALSTLILVDRDMLITDTGRAPDDYGRMGLPTNSRSRHFEQADGWIHAVDLRTTGRGFIKNRGVQFYFWLMGFDTRRHVGTADHLHVELN